jgi:hypothetical protein
MGRGPGHPSDRNPSRRRRARVPLSTGAQALPGANPPGVAWSAGRSPRCAWCQGRSPGPWHSGRDGPLPGRLARCWTAQQDTAAAADVNRMAGAGPPKWPAGGPSPGRPLGASMKRFPQRVRGVLTPRSAGGPERGGGADRGCPGALLAGLRVRAKSHGRGPSR